MSRRKAVEATGYDIEEIDRDNAADAERAASLSDVDAVVLLRGPAIVNGNDLVFTGTPTASEITAAATPQSLPVPA